MTSHRLEKCNVVSALIVASGCVGDGRVDLAAADSMHAVSAALEVAVAEYDADLSRLDDDREAAAIRAFADRVRRDAADETLEEQIVAFSTAMTRLRADRRVTWERLAATRDNLATLREVAEGLRRIGFEALSLEDETRRYLESTLQRLRQSAESKNPDARLATKPESPGGTHGR